MMAATPCGYGCVERELSIVRGLQQRSEEERGKFEERGGVDIKKKRPGRGKDR